jgi:hypothetical protein
MAKKLFVVQDVVQNNCGLAKQPNDLGASSSGHPLNPSFHEEPAP